MAPASLARVRRCADGVAQGMIWCPCSHHTRGPELLFIHNVQALLRDQRRQPFVTFGHSQKAAVEGLGIGSLFTGGVFFAAQRTVMIQVASGEVLAEPLVALDVIRSQSTSLCRIQGVEVWTRRGG